jgi:hypothetical protein
MNASPKEDVDMYDVEPQFYTQTVLAAVVGESPHRKQAPPSSTYVLLDSQNFPVFYLYGFVQNA